MTSEEFRGSSIDIKENEGDIQGEKRRNHPTEEEENAKRRKESIEEEEEEGEVIDSPPSADLSSSLQKRRESPPSSHKYNEKASDRYRERSRDRSRERSRDRSRERSSDREDRRRDFSRYDNREKDRYSDRSRDYDGKRERDIRDRDWNRNDRERENRERLERERMERERAREEERKKEEEERRKKEEEKKRLEDEEKRKEEEYKLKVSQQLAQLQNTEVSEEEEARRRRERRRQIMEKHKQTQSTETLPPNNEEKPQENIIEKVLETPKEVPQEEKTTTTNNEEDDMFGDKPVTVNEPEQTKNGINLLQKEKELEEKHLDEFDMFGHSPIDEKFEMTKENTQLNATNYMEVTDDAEGYYCYSVGEVLNGKYRIAGNFGKGVFSTVLRAVEVNTDKKVAVKILRNNDAMKRSGYKEIQFLNQLAKVDPDSKYTVKFLDHFEDRQHLCIVFESMEGGNLREVLKRFGTKVGLSMAAVRLYTQRLMLALRILKKCEFLHSDIKPDNILVNAQKIVKLGDFGSGFPASENTINPDLVSRYYRAPEITLGLKYDYGIDMWSVGCSLYEISTGSILFPGRNHNDLLYRHLEVTGPCSKKLLKKGAYVSEHFDSNGVFNRLFVDKTTGKEFAKPTQILKPTRDIKKELLSAVSTPEEKRLAMHLGDLLSKIFVLDPSLRITPEEALKHPFVTNS